ncbi:C-C chemokine receptor type 1 [Protobothrops mucrosquamatus]|uniref:C-C chemokine receptor type 1 n=1 Tax=Protobothrops mucrosquamatus TaxID=103944 RepID=UPI0007759C49|nr:C-C chemokine receptor type 1 [Protobothrops mucrosquamatus]XP_015678535.1 C-C chemokine receptor type 1 [Protobothrops mucrosquamatus]
MNGITDEAFPITEFDYDDAVTPCHSVGLQTFVSNVLPAFYSLVFIFGLVGNVLVVLVLIKYKKIKGMTDIYLLNLAISDLFFIFSLPFRIYYSIHDWIFGDTMCKIYAGIFFLCFYSGSFFIVLLTIDRYLDIIYSASALKSRTIRYGIITSIHTWGLAILVSSPGLIFFGLQMENYKKSCTYNFPHENHFAWNKFFILKMFFIGLIFPMMIMTFCYIRILNALLKSRNAKKNKTAWLIFIIMVTYFLFWAPNNICFLLQLFHTSFFADNCDNLKRMNAALQLTETVAVAHCCINPLIYAFASEKFKKYVISFFHP